MGRTDISALPADLLRYIYKVGLEQGEITLKDRVRALGVCHEWKQLLSTAVLPIPKLKLPASAEGLELCKWAAAARPHVKELSIGEGPGLEPDLLSLAIHSLPCEALRVVDWGTAYCAPILMPHLNPWLRLERLDLFELPFDATWLQQLSCLQRLQDLDLILVEPLMEEEEEQTVLFPSLPSLTRLSLQLLAEVHMEMQLSSLPRLLELGALGQGSLALERSNGAPPSQLHSAALETQDLAVDFTELPALGSVALSPMRMKGAATIAAATFLTRLQLGDEERDTLDRGWVIEVLRHVPRASLRVVGVMGGWTAEAAVLVGNMANLSGLFLDGIDSFFHLPPSSAPLWGQLRAFGWGRCSSSYPLPEALASATRLEALQVFFTQPFVQELRLLAALPALCRLILVTNEAWFVVDEELQDAALWVVGRVLPNLLELAGSGGAKDSSKDFADWALGS